MVKGEEKMERVEKIDGYSNWLDKVLSVLAVTCLLISVGLAFIGVILRYQFGVSYQVLEEICRYAIVYGVFIYIGPLIKKDEHIKMTFLDEKLGEKSKQLKDLLLSVILFISLVILSYASIIWVSSIYDMKLNTLSGEMLMVIPASAILIGMVLSAVYAALEVIKDVTLLKSE